VTVAEGSRRQADGIEDQILTSARDLCREVGHDQFTMAMVADRVGCARATVYNHFRDRTDLIESLCTTYLDGYLDIHGRIRRWIESHHTVFDVLRETVAEELRWRVANGDLRGALDAAKGQRKSFYLAGDQRIDEAMLDWFGDIYLASDRHGLLRDGVDARIAARAIYAMVDHVVAGFAVDTPPEEVRHTIDQVALLQWQAVFRMPPDAAPRFDTLTTPIAMCGDTTASMSGIADSATVMIGGSAGRTRRGAADQWRG
jgi:AcrR family transcriptional regulator